VHKKLFYKIFETNSYFSIYRYFPHFLDSERKLPRVSFHPYSYGENFLTWNSDLVMKKNKITDSIFIKRHFCSCWLLHGRSGEQWQPFSRLLQTEAHNTYNRLCRSKV